MQYRKAITYQSFMELQPISRREHSEYFKNNYPDYCPVALKVLHGNKEVVLKMCKFLIRRNHGIIEQQEVIKNFVLKHTQGVIAKTDQLIFVYGKKVVNQNITVGKFLEENYKDEQGDGWLHLMALTQDVYG